MVRLRDSDGGGDGGESAEALPRPEDIHLGDDAPAAARAETDGSNDLDGAERVAEIASKAAADPESAGNFVGELIRIAEAGDRESLEAVDDVLDAIGRERPVEFEVWSEWLVRLAGSGRDDLAFLGLRSLAQLASVRPRAASNGLDVAFENLTAPDTSIRRAALSVLAEVGPASPSIAGRADRPIATAIHDPNPSIRMAGVIAAGRLLPAAPTELPRSAQALIEALGDGDEQVERFAHIGLLNLARERPTAVPDRERAIKAIAAVSDGELGLRRGASDEALADLLELELGYPIDLQ